MIAVIVGSLILGVATTTLSNLQILAFAAISMTLVLALPNLGRISVRRESRTAGERVVVGCMVFAAFTATWNGVKVEQVLTLSDIGLILGFLAALPVILAQGSSIRLPPWLVAPVVVLMIVSLIGIIFFGHPVTGVVPTFRLAAAMILAPMLIGIMGSRLGIVTLLVDAWIASMAVSGLIATADYLFGTGFGPAITGIPAFSRSAGIATHPNHLAITAVLTIPLCIARLSASRTTGGRLLSGVGVTAAALAILVSGSRGGLIAGIAAFLLALLWMQSRIRSRSAMRLAIVAALASTIFMILSPSTSFVAIERTFGQSPSEQTEVSNRLRAESRSDAIEVIKKNPLVGSGTDWLRGVSNIYLQLLAASGIVGLIAYLTYLLGYFRLSIKLRSSDRIPIDLRAIAAGAGLSAVLLALVGVVENQISDRYLYFPCGFVLAVSFSLIANEGKINALVPSGAREATVEPTQS